LECAYARNGVRVNTIDPGVVQTPAWEKLSLITDGEHKDGPQQNAAAEFAKSVVPVGYHAVPDDVAEAMMFLVTSGSHYMTGAELLFDGGLAIAPAAGVHRT
jgi:NAD(P)-dependent dehydrogenase (short-subunit alcohol dehydrogenase family)